MTADDVELGLVYRWRRFGPLFVVVEVIEGEDPGAHVWLALDGDHAGQSRRVEPFEIDRCGSNFQFLDYGSEDPQ